MMGHTAHRRQNGCGTGSSHFIEFVGLGIPSVIHIDDANYAFIRKPAFELTCTSARGTWVYITFHLRIFSAMSARHIAVTLFRIEGDCGMKRVAFSSLAASVAAPSVYDMSKQFAAENSSIMVWVALSR